MIPIFVQTIQTKYVDLIIIGKMKHNNFIKSIISLLIVAVSSLALTSCDGLFGGFDIVKQESIDKNLKSELLKVIPEDVSVVMMRLSKGGDTFTTHIDNVFIVYFDAGTENIQSKVIYLDRKNEIKDWSVPSKYINDDDNSLRVSSSEGVKLKDIDFSRIAAMVNEGGEVVTNSGNEFSGIDDFTINFNSDPKKIAYEFTIESFQDSKTTSKNGRLAIQTKIRKFEFTADSEGNITEKE